MYIINSFYTRYSTIEQNPTKTLLKKCATLLKKSRHAPDIDHLLELIFKTFIIPDAHLSFTSAVLFYFFTSKFR